LNDLFPVTKCLTMLHAYLQIYSSEDKLHQQNQN